MLLADAAELGILAQEAVTRMNGIRVGDLRRRDDPAHVQVAVLTWWRADAHSLVGEANVQAFAVRGAVDRYRLDAHLAGGTKIGSRSWLGVGSVTKQLIEIGHDCTIGAGAAVVQNVYNDSTVMGVPARLKS